MENYTELAMRTENQDSEGISQRLEQNIDKVLPALNKAILALQELDYTVKKECFYGKPPKFYEAPLFRKGAMSQDVLKNEAFVRLLHGFMGIGTEAGEGLEALAEYYNTGNLDKVNVGEELGDVFWYSAIIADECQTSFSVEQEKNIKKLAARHGEKFSDVKVMDRNLDKERAILESAPH